LCRWRPEGAEGSNAGISRVRDSEIEVRAEWIVEDVGSHNELQAMRGRLPCVLNCEVEKEYSVASCRLIAAADRNVNISAQSPFGGVLKMSKLTLAGIPKAVGRGLERVSEPTNSDGREGGQGDRDSTTFAKSHLGIAITNAEFVELLLSDRPERLLDRMAPTGGASRRLRLPSTTTPPTSGNQTKKENDREKRIRAALRLVLREQVSQFYHTATYCPYGSTFG
jgi:hypothetical protein